MSSVRSRSSVKVVAENSILLEEFTLASGPRIKLFYGAIPGRERFAAGGYWLGLSIAILDTFDS